MTSTYDNISNPITFIEVSGATVIANSYKISFASLLDSSTELSSTLADSEEIVVVRKFPAGSISPDLTAAEAWSAWTLPNDGTSGSSMYSVSGTDVVMSQTASDYTWTTTMSGRSADVTLPALTASDTVYVLRKTFSLDKFVTWAPGSRITSENLNLSTDQSLFLIQELYNMLLNMPKLNPAMGTISGICPLNASGTVDPAFIDGNSLAIATENGVQGAGTSADKLRLKLASSSALVADSDGVKVDLVDNVTTDSSVKALTAKQGKELNDLISGLGTGIQYKGAFDVTAARTGANDPAGGGTLTAGMTIVHTGSTGTAHANWTGIAGSSVTQYALCRYDGASWDVVSSSNILLTDGSVPLASSATLTTTAGTVLVSTQSSDDNSTKAASTGYVAQEIAATTINELADVTGSATNGNILKVVSGNYTSVAPSDGTNGISINDLKDVDTTGVNNNYFLRYDSTDGRFEAIAEPSSLTASLVTFGGDGDGTEDNTALTNAFNSTSLGEVEDDATASSTLRLCDGGGRHYGATTGITLSNRIGRTYSNLKVTFDATGEQTFLKNTVSTIQIPIEGIAYGGENIIEISESDSNLIKEGQQIVFAQGGTALGSDGFIRSSVNAGSQTFAASPTITDDFYNYGGSAGYKVIQSYLQGTRKFITLDKPLDTTLSNTITNAELYGSDDSANGVDELRDLVFENVTLINKKGKTFYPSKSGNGASSTGAGTGTGTPFVSTADSTDLKFNAEEGHSLVAGSGSGTTDRDYVRIEDEDFTGKFVGTDANNQAQWKNSKQIKASGITNNQITITTTTNASSSATFGSGNAVIILDDKKTGVELTGANKVVFRKCRFEGWTAAAVVLDKCHDVLFEDCTFVDCRGNYLNEDVVRGAITLKNKNSNITVRRCKFLNCGVGIDSTKSGIATATRNDSCCTDLVVEDCFFFCKLGISTQMLLAGRTVIKNNVFRYKKDIRNIFVGDFISKAVDLKGGAEELILEENDAYHFGYCPDETYDATGYYGTGKGHTKKASLATAWTEDRSDITNEMSQSDQVPQWNCGFEVEYTRSSNQIYDRGYYMIGDKPTNGGTTGGQADGHGDAVVYGGNSEVAPYNIQIKGNKVAAFGYYGIHVRTSCNKELLDTRVTAGSGKYQNIGGILINKNTIVSGRRGIGITAAWESDNFRVGMHQVQVSENLINICPVVLQFGLWDTSNRLKSFWPGWNDAAFAKCFPELDWGGDDNNLGGSSFRQTKLTAWSAVNIQANLVDGTTRVRDVDIERNRTYGPHWGGYYCGCAYSMNGDADPTQMTSRWAQFTRIIMRENCNTRWACSGVGMVYPDDGTYSALNNTQSTSRRGGIRKSDGGWNSDLKRNYPMLGCVQRDNFDAGYGFYGQGSTMYNNGSSYFNHVHGYANLNPNNNMVDGIYTNFGAHNQGDGSGGPPRGDNLK